MVRRVATILTSGLYAIPALTGAAITVIASLTGTYRLPAAPGAALVCSLIRLAGIRYHLHVPVAPEVKDRT